LKTFKGIDMQDQLDRIEAKLDQLIELLAQMDDEQDDQGYYGERDQTQPL
jgi:hypothetical protein